MNRKRLTWVVLLTLLAVGLSGCNAFESMSDKNSREARLEEARIAMDQGDYTTAVGLLDALHASYPADVEISRARASALAGRSGLDLLGLAAQAATAADNASINQINQLMKTLPNPVTDAHLADAQSAIDAWKAIASTPNDFYSLALAQATLGLLTLDKDLVNPATGLIDATASSRIFSISDTHAETLYASITDALVNLGPGKAGLATDSDVLKSLGDIKSGIDARSGTVAEKVRAYLSSQSWI